MLNRGACSVLLCCISTCVQRAAQACEAWISDGS